MLVIIVWLAWALPLAFEHRSLFLRDVITGALPLKFFGADQLRQGAVPIFNPLRALGQPHSGNPNTLPFYPGNLLYVVLPSWSAFNLHYALHLLLSWLAMMVLCRKLGLSREASLLGGITYAGSGWVLTCLTFYNILTVAAWWPLAMLGAVSKGRRGVALGGLAVGMAVLGGEPVTTAIGLVPLVWLAMDSHGFKRGLIHLTAIGTMAVLIALPQLVATLRVFDFTVRGGPGLPASMPGVRAFHPIRMLEFVLPFPFGRPGELGPAGYWELAGLPTVPYFYTVYFGIIAIWLALVGKVKASGWWWLALAGIGMGWIGGLWPGLLEGASSGLFRYAEKFLFWVALSVPVLAGFGLDRVVKSPGMPKVVLPWVGGASLVGLTVLLYLLAPAIRGSAMEAAEGAPQEDAGRQISATLEGLDAHLESWLIGLAVGGALLILAGFAARQRNGAFLVVLQLVGLAQLYPLAQTMDLGLLTRPSPWMKYLPAGASIHNTYLGSNTWQGPPAYELDPPREETLAPIRAADLDPAFGLATGFSYPLAHDFEGIYSPLNAFLLQELDKAGWSQRVNWLRVLGVEFLLGLEDPGVDSLTMVAAEEHYGVQIQLFQIEEPAPRAWWPDTVSVVPDPVEQFATVSRSASPIYEVTVPFAIAHSRGARVEVLEHRPDRWQVEVESDGGLLILRRSYQPLLRARTGNQALTTMPADFCLLGVSVPPGHHLVTVEASRWPQTAASTISIAALGLVLGLGWRR